MEFDWWNTIHAREKLPYVHVVQWFGMFWLDFERFFHGTWWNVSCLACELWGKKTKQNKTKNNLTANLFISREISTLIDKAVAKAANYNTHQN